MKIGIKYCGGCNPRFDRSQIVLRLKSEFKDLQIQSANTKETFDLIVVITGCASRCASHSELNGRFGKVIISHPDDYPILSKMIDEIYEQQRGH